MKMKKYAIIAAAAMAGMAVTACSKDEAGPDAVEKRMQVTVGIAGYETPDGAVATDEREDVEDIRACMFEDGRLKSVHHPSEVESGEYSFDVERTAGTLYVVANAGRIRDFESMCTVGTDEELWLAMTAETDNGVPVRFLSGKAGLDGMEEAASVTLTRSVARIDLRIRTVGRAVVEELTFRGAAMRTGVFAAAGKVSEEHGDIVIRPEVPYTEDTAGVARLYEQESSGPVLVVRAVIDGREYEMEAELPKSVSRNRIYVAYVTKEHADRDAVLTVEEWSDGGGTDLTPDFDGRITIDRGQSVLPSGVTVSEDGTGLTLPYVGTELLLALDCNDELEMLPVTGHHVTVEPADGARGLEGRNMFRVRKPLYAPGMEAEEVRLMFRRRGLGETYPEDAIVLNLSSNPTVLEGQISFDTDSYAFDFGRYVDNELGRFTLPEGKELAVEFETGEDEWVKLVPSQEDANTIRVLGGWKPNDATANGRMQSATLVIRNASDGSEPERYTVSRRNYGLPVTWLHGVWWCKYNARGDSRSFDGQILCSSDPAAAAGKTVLDYLRDCTAEEFRDLWGWAYQGDSGQGMQVVDSDGKLVMEGFSTGIPAHINKLPADALSPDGYELPSMEEFNRVFDATDYVWMMWSGTHRLRNPWEGHDIVKREQRRRNDVTVGTVSATDLIYIGMWSPDFGEYEPVVWYGPGAQWNADGIRHSNHYNNILFSVHSPEGSGWYMNGGMSGLYMAKNGAGNNDTRILRFKKSPVEYIYGL